MRRTVWAVRPPGPCRYPSRPAYARAQMSGRRGPPKTHRSLPARGPGLNIPVGTAESPPGPRTDKGRFCRMWRERDRPGGRPCPLRRPVGLRALRHTAIVAHGRRRRLLCGGAARNSRHADMYGAASGVRLGPPPGNAGGAARISRAGCAAVRGHVLAGAVFFHASSTAVCAAPRRPAGHRSS